MGFDVFEAFDFISKKFVVSIWLAQVVRERITRERPDKRDSKVQSYMYR